LGPPRQRSADIPAISLLADLVLIFLEESNRFIVLLLLLQKPAETLSRLRRGDRGTATSSLSTATTLQESCQGPLGNLWGRAGTSNTREQAGQPSWLLSYHLILGRTSHKDLLFNICFSA